MDRARRTGHMPRAALWEGHVSQKPSPRKRVLHPSEARETARVGRQILLSQQRPVQTRENTGIERPGFGFRCVVSCDSCEIER